MKTPKEYQDNLKKGIITEEMFTDCLYSVNKRAKNYRNKAREYKSRYRHSYIAVDSQYSKMNEFYALKERFLKYLEPICIHKQFVGYEKERVYSYEKEYRNRKGKTIVWENCYYDYELDDEVWFYDYELDIKKYLYFLYYELTDRSFHTPIDNPNSYGLKIVEIDSDFTTYGDDPKYLLSPQFVKKVIDTLDNLNCKLVLNNGTTEFTDRLQSELPKKSVEAPTENQRKFIKDICDFYGFNFPELKSKNKAKTWINNILKEYNFHSDKRKAETDKRNKLLYKDFLDGMTHKELSEKYSIAIGTVRLAIRTNKKYWEANSRV